MDAEPRPTGALTAATGVAVLLAMLAFAPVVQGWLWWWESAALVAVVLIVAAAGRRLGMPSVAAALTGASAVLPMAALVVVGPAGLLQQSPRLSAVAVMDAAAQAFTQIYYDSVPAVGTAQLAVVMAGGAALVALAADLVVVGLRAPIAGMLVVLAVAIVPGKTFSTGTDGWVLVLVAAAALAVVAADRRRRGAPPRVLGLAAGGAVAVVLALAAQVVLPAPASSQASGIAAPLFGTGVDPLVRLGENLRRGATTDVLTYTTTSRDKDVYLRLAVLEDFSGRDWKPNDPDGLPARNTTAPPAEGLTPEVATGTVRTTVTPASVGSIGSRLPLPYPATAVVGLDGTDFKWDEEGLTLVRQGSDTVGPYSVESESVAATPARLRAAAVAAPSGDDASIQLPSSVPSIIRTTADAWTRGAATPYDQALAIQNRLRGGGFLYDEQTPVQQGYDGDGLGVIATFLRVKAGYCIHYASTMAVMARLEGIPSRIVVGYQPGQAKGNARLVTSDDLHAWPELFFDGIGWVRFEPTPGQGVTPAYAPLPTSSASAAPSDALPSKDAPSDAASQAATASGSSGGGGFTISAPVVRGTGVTAAVLGLLAVPALLRRGVRRRRLRGGARGPGASAAWRELLDSFEDLGLSTGRGRTPRETEAVLLRQVDPTARVRDALGRIRGTVEREAYSPEPVPVNGEDVRTAIGAAEERVGFRRRLFGALAPRSLAATLTRVATGVQVVTTGERPRWVRVVRLGPHRGPRAS